MHPRPGERLEERPDARPVDLPPAAQLPPGPPPYWSPATPHLPAVAVRPADLAAPPRPRWRRARRLCLVLAGVGVLAAATGVVVAVRTVQLADTPEATVRAYFDALARGDARTALAAGAVPAGGRVLVSDDVLRATLDRAPLDQVRTGAVTRSGDTAAVAVRYRVGGPSPTVVDDRVDLVRTGDGWRLRRSAVPVVLSVVSATSWAAVPASSPFAVPGDVQLAFPGAAPVEFRSPRLQVAAGSGLVRLDATDSTVRVEADVSARGRADVTDALRTALAACAKGGQGTDPFCPQPPSGQADGVTLRPVPRSFAGTYTGLDGLAPDIAVAPDSAGILSVSGSAPAKGTWQVLDYDNLPADKSGAVTVTFGATLPVGADTLLWERT